MNYDMAPLGRKNIRREFNPFNLKNKITDNKYDIKFERLENRYRTKPFWWLSLVFIIVIVLYWYLTRVIN